eukprot:362931-Chlamydomonas_euryale.AAC.1
MQLPRHGGRDAGMPMQLPGHVGVDAGQPWHAVRCRGRRQHAGGSIRRCSYRATVLSPSR